ncbi:MAG: hypothetical protein M3Y35_08330 [Actinomycetota bacterium]|nr:hypothetical protein [Actinomycetota bacterium]
MPDIYVYDFSGGEEERVRREAERAAQRAQVRARYTQRVTDLAGVDEITADLVMSALFDHVDVVTGELCQFGNHPKLPNPGGHGDAGFDCRCQWSQERRAAATRRWLTSMNEFWASPEAQAATAKREAEREEIEAWIAAHPGVQVRQTTEFAPEQWEGHVDGRSFYFRERHGHWRIELDLEPDGHFANRLVGTGEDGKVITEPLETTSGSAIAEGVDSALGATDLARLEFIVRTIREHISGETCPHVGAIAFCPTCGVRCGHMD